jgi:hypothetical protein
MITMATAQQPNISLSLAQAPLPQVDADRKQEMRNAWKAYRGDFQKPLKVSANQPDDNVITNRCGPIVDKGVSFLFGQTLKIEASDETAQPDATIQDFLNGLWGDDDDRMTLLSQLAINGGVCGQVYAKIIPAQGQMKYPRIVVLDPLIMRMVSAPDDCTLTLAYMIEYPGPADLQKRQIIARVDPDSLAGIAGEYDLDDTWTITNYQRRGQTGIWYQIGEQEIWPYPFAPIFTCQNLPNPNEAWGAPDLAGDIINLNKVLNFLQSNISRILKFHAHPKTWGKGFRAEQMSVAVDDLFIIESQDGTLQSLEMKSDLSSSLKFVADMRSDMDEQSRIPGVALGRLVDLPRGTISGIALQLLFQPIIEKTTQKRRLYGRFIRDISRAALVIAGKISLEEYEAYPIGIHWQEMLPPDDLQAAQTALLLQQMGVSRATLLAQLGYDAEEEEEKSNAEAQRQNANATRTQAIMAPGQQPMPQGQQQQEDRGQ